MRNKINYNKPSLFRSAAARRVCAGAAAATLVLTGYNLWKPESATQKSQPQPTNNWGNSQNPFAAGTPSLPMPDAPVLAVAPTALATPTAPQPTFFAAQPPIPGGPPLIDFYPDVTSQLQSVQPKHTTCELVVHAAMGPDAASEERSSGFERLEYCDWPSISQILRSQAEIMTARRIDAAANRSSLKTAIYPPIHALVVTLDWSLPSEHREKAIYLTCDQQYGLQDPAMRYMCRTDVPRP